MNWLARNVSLLIAGMGFAAVALLAPIRSFPQILAPILFANTVASPPLSGMLLWWSADVGSNCSSAVCSDGGSQNSWADQSGNGNNGTLTPSITSACVASVFHTNQINGKPALTFNGVNTAGSETCFSVGNSGVGLNNKSATSMFLVAKLASTSVISEIASGTSGSFDWRGSQTTIPAEQIALKACTSGLGNGTATTDTSWHQMNVTYNGTAISFRINRASDGSASPGTSITTNWLTLGINPCGGSFNAFDGQIAEFILYSRVLSGTEITTVETYLHGKYGL